MRYIIQISVPAILSTAVLVFGLVAILLSSLEVNKGRLGSEFVISISPLTLSIYLLGLIYVVFRFLRS